MAQAAIAAMGVPGLQPADVQVTQTDAPVAARLLLGMAGSTFAAQARALQAAFAADLGIANASHVALAVVSSAARRRAGRLLLQSLAPESSITGSSGLVGPTVSVSVTLTGFGADNAAADAASAGLLTQLTRRDAASALFCARCPLATAPAVVSYGPERSVVISLLVYAADASSVNSVSAALNSSAFGPVLTVALSNAGVPVATVAVLSPPAVRVAAAQAPPPPARALIVYVGVALAATALCVSTVFTAWVLWSRHGALQRARARALDAGWPGDNPRHAQEMAVLPLLLQPRMPPMPHAVFSVGCDLPAVAFATMEVPRSRGGVLPDAHMMPVLPMPRPRPPPPRQPPPRPHGRSSRSGRSGPLPPPPLRPLQTQEQRIVAPLFSNDEEV
jgi:hypothetical protein